MPGPAAASREVRLALVLNGGVSLAIWMGGVVGEIDALRRAGDAADDAGPDLEFWRELLRCLDADVLVDVVSGTSAGGINGALLATAIARDTPLPNLRDTWIDLARYEEDLLIKHASASALSVLDGDFFLRKVRDTIAAIGPSDAASSTAREVTLFMTGTALVGDNTDYLDEDGQRFTATDHRIRFTFRRNGERNDFADDGDEMQATRRLARAARASASFPAAFEPIYINNTGIAEVPPASPSEEAPEGPDMSEITGLAQSRWAIDGGVLDNEPFRPLLTEIAGRPVSGPLDRVIAYVVPSLGEVLPDPISDAVTPAPGVLRSVPAAFSLPRGMSSLDDLEGLERLAESANTDRSTRKRLLSRTVTGELEAPDAALFRLYRERRRDATAWEIRKLARQRASHAGVYLRALPESGENGTCNLPWLPTALAETVDADGRWAWGVVVAHRFLRNLLGLVRDQVDSGTLSADRQHDLDGVVGTLSDELTKLDTIQAELSEQLARALAVDEVYTLTDIEVNSLAVPRFHAGVAAGEAAAGASLWPIVRDAAKLVVNHEALPADWNLPQGDEGARRLVGRFLWAEVYGRVAAAPEYTPTPRFRFYRFGLKPSTWFLDSELHFTRKLMGTQVHHFGAFFKDEWRAYDWTWGRLDGASHLLNALVTRDSLERALSRPDGAACFSALAPDGTAMTEAIDAYRKAAARGEDEAAEESVREIRGLLSRARHASILQQELATIAEHWDADKPEGLDRAGGWEDASHEELRVTWTGVCHDLGGTSALSLAGHGAGRQILGWSIASFLRAISLDAGVPKRIKRPLRWIAAGVRALTSSTFLGFVSRGAVVLGTFACLALAVFLPVDGWLGTVLRAVLGAVGGLFLPLAIWLLPLRFRRPARAAAGRVSLFGKVGRSAVGVFRKRR